MALIITDYTIVSEYAKPDEDSFLKGVIDYMKEGWQPIGGVSVILSGTKKVEGQDFEEDTFFYSQAMVKYINRD
jgi:hypothetical protein